MEYNKIELIELLELKSMGAFRNLERRNKLEYQLNLIGFSIINKFKKGKIVYYKLKEIEPIGKYNEEEWRDIKGYEGYYKVSIYGQVRSLTRQIIREDGKIKTYYGKVLSPNKTKNGYLEVHLYNKEQGGDERNRTPKLIHRLVAEAFIPNPDNKTEVNHKDLNRSNNNIDNLEWVTTLENMNYGDRVERCAKGNMKKIKCEQTGQIFNSVTEASEFYEVSRTTIKRGIISKGLTFIFV